MLIVYEELRDVVQNRWIMPVPDAHVNASSIDVRLGPKLLRERSVGVHQRTVDLGKREPLNFYTLDISETAYALRPGEFVLAQTLETFDLPLDVSAEFRLKSSVARMGLSHALAVWCDPGWNGSALTLELHNLTHHHTILLHAGDRVGQMIFHRHAPVPAHAGYNARGAYNNDRETTATKPEKTP